MHASIESMETWVPDKITLTNGKNCGVLIWNVISPWPTALFGFGGREITVRLHAAPGRMTCCSIDWLSPMPGILKKCSNVIKRLSIVQ